MAYLIPNKNKSCVCITLEVKKIYEMYAILLLTPYGSARSEHAADGRGGNVAEICVLVVVFP